MSKYETIGGIVTRHEAEAKLLWLLSEAADQAAIISHLFNTEDDDLSKLNAKGWLGVHGLLMRCRHTINEMMRNKLQ